MENMVRERDVNNLSNAFCIGLHPGGMVIYLTQLYLLGSCPHKCRD